MNLTKKIGLLILFVLFSKMGAAQLANVFNDFTEDQPIKHMALLPDRGYPLQRVVTDTSLHFIETDTLKNAKVCWLRVIVFNPTDHQQSLNINVWPNFDNTFYHFNRFNKKWVGDNTGVFSRDAPWLYGIHAYELPGRQRDTLYFKINVNTPYTLHKPLVAKVTATPKVIADDVQQKVRIAWLVGILVLLLFSINNLYIFISFRDKTVLYYIVIQLGGMMYITGYWYFFSMSPPYHLYSYLLDDQLYLYNIDKLLHHLGIVFILYGCINLCRTYLITPITLPVWDKILKYGLYGYVIQFSVVALVNLNGFYLDYYTVKYDNIYFLSLVLVLLYTSVKAYLQKLPLAGSFLLANLIPLICVIAVALYHLLVSPSGSHNYWLPTLAITSQAFGFSLALVTRTKAIQNRLAATEDQRSKLQNNLEEMELQNKLNETEIRMITSDIEAAKQRNDTLQEKIEAHQRELASSTLYMVQKNELLTNLKTQVQDLKRSDRYHIAKNLQEMTSLLENNIQLDMDWGKFKLHFEQVHPDFFDDLISKYPNLTQKEIRLYAYFHMKFSHKEIAAMLDIDPASVRRAKTRLLKKMAITKIE